MTIDDFRPIPFYFLNTTNPADLSAEAVEAAMRNVRDAGYGRIAAVYPDLKQR